MMYRIEGISVATGVAIGKARIIKEKLLTIGDYMISEDQIAEEIAFFKNSVENVINDINQYKQNFDINKEDNDILETHKMILLDPDFHLSVENLITNDRKNIEQAVFIHFKRTIEYFKNLDNELYSERATDYEDVYRRLLLNVKRIDINVLDTVEPGDIVVINDLPPSMVSQIHRKGAVGIVLSKGAKTSHSVIISRALGIPIVTGIKFQHVIHNDDILIIDSKKGFVIGKPDDSVFEKFVQLQKQIKIEFEQLVDYIDFTATSANAENLKILANIDLPIEVDHVLELNSDGIGLFRTESFYLDRANLPSEEEQFAEYKMIAQKLGNKPFIIRTIDLGGDKVAGWYTLEKETNPNLGCRGIRFSLKFKHIFKTQLRAILRASAYGDISIMFPMVASVEELMQAKAALEECKADLKKAKIPFNKKVAVGTMIETPSAAICSGGLAKVSDFFSIGTNDLLQYTVAVDRNNDYIADYYNSYNPAFLILLLKTIQNAIQNKIPVAVCGELANDTNFTAFLLNAGVKELSVGFDHIIKMKKFIRSIDTVKATKFIDKLYDCSTISEAKEFIKMINGMCLSSDLIIT